MPLWDHALCLSEHSISQICSLIAECTHLALYFIINKFQYFNSGKSLKMGDILFQLLFLVSLSTNILLFSQYSVHYIDEKFFKV